MPRPTRRDRTYRCPGIGRISDACPSIGQIPDTTTRRHDDTTTRRHNARRASRCLGHRAQRKVRRRFGAVNALRAACSRSWGWPPSPPPSPRHVPHPRSSSPGTIPHSPADDEIRRHGPVRPQRPHRGLPHPSPPRPVAPRLCTPVGRLRPPPAKRRLFSLARTVVRSGLASNHEGHEAGIADGGGHGPPTSGRVDGIVEPLDGHDRRVTARRRVEFVTGDA